MSRLTLTALIIEDEHPARLRLQQLLAPYEWLSLYPPVDTAAKAIKSIDTLLPQVVFMDIHLPDQSGLDVLQCIEHKPYVIFTTAYEEYALKAFDSLSVDYLLKPLTSEQVERAMKKLLVLTTEPLLPQSNLEEVVQVLTELKTSGQKQHIPVTKGHKMIFIHHEEVIFIRAENKYSIIHTTDGKKHFSDKPLIQLEKSLPNDFIRIHRSYIVSKSKIASIRRSIKSRYVVTLVDTGATQLATSDSYKLAFKESMNL